jgi:hypothetical protein
MTASASCGSLMHNERMPELPDTHRKKSLNEQLQEIANANLVRAITAGFQEIDRRAAQAKKALDAAGITGIEDLVDSFSRVVKLKSVELATGRKQAKK